MNATLFVLHHVKSHKDNNKLFHNLFISEKLNVYCQQLTTRRFNDITDSNCIVPFSPISKIFFIIDTTIITHHISPKIRHL